MMVNRHNVRPYLKVFDDLGLEVVDTEVTGSNHYKITVTSGDKRCFFIAPRSASDVRSLQNFKSLVKRWKRSPVANTEVEFS